MLRLAFAEGEFEALRKLQDEISGSGLTEEQRQRYIEREVDEIIGSR